MRLKDYFNKNFQTSDRNAIDTLRTHYYYGRMEQVTEGVCSVLKKDGCVIRYLDLERHEISFDHREYQGVATLCASSFTEIACDFNILTFNILPTAKGKKVIERLYEKLDNELQLKKVGK